ncbi:unnamed protein product, partial [Ixodes hexagonus]
THAGSTLKPHGFGAPNSGRPMDFGQQREDGPRSAPQVEKRYQMGGFPTYASPPPFGQPAQPSQPSEPGLSGAQQGNSPTPQVGQGSGTAYPSLYGMYSRWISSLGQGPYGGNGRFGLQPATSRQEDVFPGSSESPLPSGSDERSSRFSFMGGQQGQSGPGGYNQWLLGTGSSGQGQSTGGPGNPSSSPGQDGQSPASSTPRTSTEERDPEVITSGPG